MASELKTDEFKTKVLESEKPVLVDFYAPWCGPCQVMAPIIDELSDKMKGRAEIFKVNVESEPALANQFQVMSIPTIIIFKKGKVAKQFNGTASNSELEAAL